MAAVRKSLFMRSRLHFFDKVTIHLDNRYYPGKTFQIITVGNSADNMYIQRASFNGKSGINVGFIMRILLKEVLWSYN